MKKIFTPWLFLTCFSLASLSTQTVIFNGKDKDVDICNLFLIDTVDIRGDETCISQSMYIDEMYLVAKEISSQEKYEELYRPQYHFSPVSGWIGDPNGLVRYNNKYHLFWWGHAISEDLIHWQEKSWPMQGNSSAFEYYSGSVVVDERNTSGLQTSVHPPMIAIFTNHNKTTELDAPALSVSNEYFSDYTNFYLYNNGNPLITPALGFRDPCVFWDALNNQWIMAIAKSNNSEILFYRSSDLKSWQQLNSFNSSIIKGWWECPDLFYLPVDGKSNNKKWVLIIGVSGKTQYFLGDFDGQSGFRIDSAYDADLKADFGNDFYAARTYRDYDNAENRTVCLGWMGNWDYANLTPTSWGRGQQSLPRELSLKTTADGIRLIQQPISELKKLRKDSVFIVNKLIQNLQALPEFTPNFNYYELEAVFEISTASQFGLNLCVNGSDMVKVGYDTTSSRLYLDRRKSGNVSFSTNFPDIAYAPLVPSEGHIKLHIYVDQSSIEIFANNGECVISSLMYPHSTSKSIQLFSTNGTTVLKNLKAYNLKSIWKTYPTSLKINTVHDSYNDIYFYPNPILSGQDLFFSIPAHLEGEKIKLQLFTLQGKILSEKSYSNKDKFIFRLPDNLNKGIYLVNIRIGIYLRNIKILIK